jgi:hypothetical protein
MWCGGPGRPPPTSASPASPRPSAIWPLTSTRCRSMSSLCGGPHRPRSGGGGGGAGLAVGVDHPRRLELHADRPARGLSSVCTTFHLRHEREAELLGIPFDTVMQAALLPIAYSVGTDFRPAARHPLDTMVTGSVVGRLGGGQDLPARPPEPSSPGCRECDIFTVADASGHPGRAQ